MSAFNVQHSPIGAFASCALGFPGPHGGLGLALGAPAGQSVHIAVEAQPGSRRFLGLPFFARQEDEVPEAFQPSADGVAGIDRDRASPVTVTECETIERTFDVVRDCWQTEAFTFTVYSPLGAVPDPAGRDDTALRRLLTPAVLAELIVDNTTGDAPRRAVVGYTGTDPVRAMRHVERDGLCGIAEGGRTAVVTNEPDARSAIGFDLAFVLSNHDEDDPDLANVGFGLGQLGLLVFDTPPGQRRTYRLAICFHEPGPVTTAVPARYLYTRWYPDIESVAAAALADFAPRIAEWTAAAETLGIAALPPHRAFMLAQAIRSYYGSSQLLVDDHDHPLWVVNEGEFRMINTLDLTVDQAAFEAKLHPWTLRNTLEHYLARYSYTDRYGISFTHDMGVTNAFAPPGRSAYERTGRADCFSYMTAEELVNWVLSAGIYATATGDHAWCEAHRNALADCLDSMTARDPGGTGGVGVDSDRVGSGAEITTYDSLDPSLGRAVASAYLATKYVVAYTWLARVLSAVGDPARAAAARAQARRGSHTILRSRRRDGTIPALLDDPSSAFAIPVVEGLAFAHATAVLADLDRALLSALRTHLDAVLRDGRCLFPDGGWRMTTGNDNSWLSKVYLAQFVARHLLGVPDDRAMADADAAHARWLQHPTEGRWAWSDQIVAGVPRGSRYYPRGVTAIHWLDEKGGTQS